MTKFRISEAPRVVYHWCKLFVFVPGRRLGWVTDDVLQDAVMDFGAAVTCMAPPAAGLALDFSKQLIRELELDYHPEIDP